MISHRYSSEPTEALLKCPQTLAVIEFTQRCQASARVGCISTGLNLLGESAGRLREVWQVDNHSQVRRGIDGPCHYSASDELMCAAVWIEPEHCQQIRAAAENAYLALLRCVRSSGYNTMLRFWNYLPKINQSSGGMEHYKQFCQGRLAAFDALGITAQEFPAASALGHHGKGAVIYALASKTAGVHFENPAQQSAYRYPLQYGPASPSFSRATQINTQNQALIFVSGTASIIGHQTIAPECLASQLETTRNNIDQLLAHISHSPTRIEALKVYLRRSEDYTQTRHFLDEVYPGVPCLYTEADVCRAELRVEIEAYCHK